ncbi:MAG: hypothetical protein HFJ48_00045 [Clostridia bacterium]|nr:hypothetical protein [Clostridia bacterium]
MMNLIYTILCIICLCIGFFTGYKLQSGIKTDKISIPNPIKTVKEKMDNKKEKEKINEQLEELNKIYQNIENYNGSSEGQEEVKGIEIGLL